MLMKCIAASKEKVVETECNSASVLDIRPSSDYKMGQKMS